MHKLVFAVYSFAADNFIVVRIREAKIIKRQFILQFIKENQHRVCNNNAIVVLAINKD